MENLVRKSFMTDLMSIEGGFTLDGGNPTYRGISSRIYPELKAEIESQTLSDDVVSDIYRNDYLYRILGYEWLESEHPELLWLLFVGKVHGSGDEDYIRIMQTELNKLNNSLSIDGILGPKTLQALKSVRRSDRNKIFSSILESSADLVSFRQDSVGYARKGIANRVLKELEFAKSYLVNDLPNRITAVRHTSRDWDHISTVDYEFQMRRS